MAMKAAQRVTTPCGDRQLPRYCGRQRTSFSRLNCAASGSSAGAGGAWSDSDTDQLSSDTDAGSVRGPRSYGRLCMRALASAACVCAYFLVPGAQEAVRGAFIQIHGALQSFPGFIESVTLIFMSELGDKTFFIAALLAMRLGRVVAFAGSVFALGMMTVISVMIGQLFSRVPMFVDASAPIGQYVGAACLLYFGIRSIMAGLKARDDGEEFLEAEEEMEQAERQGRIKARRSPLSSFSEVATLIFLAEWGDRSMLATIALAVHSSPWGVTVGATLGHALATVIAVVAGALASKYISERFVSLIGGVLFILFAAETGFGLGLL